MQQCKIIDAKSPWATLDWSKFIEPREDIIIYNDTFGAAHDSRPQRKVFFNLEPESIIPTEAYLLQNYKLFKYILTFNQNVFDNCPNAIKYTHGTTWITEKDYLSTDANVDTKQYKISIMTGTKCMTKGHEFRLNLYKTQAAFKNFPIVFWRSSAGQLLPELVKENNPILPREMSSKIEMLRDYQFHICIENSRQQNYFSEKLMDCLLTKTIPIYYGCPNITDYFDTTGWIILQDESPSTLFKALLSLNGTYYSKYKDTINKNYEEAKKYTDIYKNVNSILSTILW